MTTSSAGGQHPAGQAASHGAGAPLAGVSGRRLQSGGADAVIAAVTAATLVPFVQALMSRAADSAYDWVRQHLRSGRPVRVNCQERQLLITISGGADDDGLAQLARMDLDELPPGCELHWDAARGTWRASGG